MSHQLSTVSPTTYGDGQDTFSILPAFKKDLQWFPNIRVTMPGLQAGDLDLWMQNTRPDVIHCHHPDSSSTMSMAKDIDQSPPDRRISRKSSLG